MNTDFSSVTPLHPHNDCRFCSFLSRATAINELDRPWLSNDKYAAIVSVGALVPGWSLVCPRSHLLNLSLEYKNQTLWTFIKKAEERLHECFHSPVWFFEHGPAIPGSLTGCGTDHAHLHAVPLSFSLRDAVLAYEPLLQWEECEPRHIPQVAMDFEYLFLVTDVHRNPATGLLTVLKEQRSQFFRKVIAETLNIGSKYDYKRFPMLDIASVSSRILQCHTRDKALRRRAANN